MKRELKRLWLRLIRSVGYPGMAGIALLIPALVLAAWLPRLKQDTQNLASSIDAKTRAAARRVQAAPRTLSEADITRDFVSGFPLLAQNSADLETLFTAASARHIMLLKGEYQLKTEPQAPFITYTATYPVRGDYATLRDFSADVLTALPNVAMDELRLTRDAVGSTALDATVRFTFFYRSP
ncbi:MAG: hypothetical protein ABI702_02065 [Burkholderiales bacterium]